MTLPARTHPSTFEVPTTDKLTGLLSMAYFRHLLREDLLPEAERMGEPLSLFMLDIDYFEGANHTYGHEVGDQILVSISEAIKNIMPEGALLCRYSGDELCAALPGTRLDDTFTLAEELRRQVQALRWSSASDLSLTCSIGLAALHTNNSNLVELLREADQALYIAKLTGRNKVALPLADSRMITKTSHYTATQLERLAQLAKTLKRNEASLLREALDDVLKKYNDLLGGPPTEHSRVEKGDLPAGSAQQG